MMTDNEFMKISEHLFQGKEDWFLDALSSEASFENVSVGDLYFLYDCGLDCLNKSKYYAPTSEEIIRFMNQHSNCTCHGRVVIKDHNPSDEYTKYFMLPYIIIEGLCLTNFTHQDRKDFLEFTKSSNILRDNEFFLYNRW